VCDIQSLYLTVLYPAEDHNHRIVPLRGGSDLDADKTVKAIQFSFGGDCRCTLHMSSAFVIPSVCSRGQ
jgi:hypothetical protein